MSFTRRWVFVFSVFSLSLFQFEHGVLAADCAVTDAGDSGTGTLRHCLDSVATDDGDLISIPAMTIHLSSGELAVTRPLTIQGAGAGLTVIDGAGNGSARIFRITTNSSAEVAIRGLTVRGARANVSGAGIYVGGTGSLRISASALRDNESGISVPALNQGGGGVLVGENATMIMEDCEVTGNSVTGHGSGAGILSSSSILIVNSLIAENDAVDTFSGAGGIDSRGVATVINSSFEGNHGLMGGGGNFVQASVTNSAFVGNTALSGGGGLAVFGGVRLDQAYFFGNRTYDGVGGGLFACGEDNEVLNVTFEGNSATGGGGVFNCGDLILANNTYFGNQAQQNGGAILNDVGASLYLVHSTVFGNSADSDDGEVDGGEGGGIMNATEASLQIGNSILAGNSDLSGGGHDCWNQGQLGAYGKVILRDPLGCETILAPADVVESLDPRLAADIGPNGGPSIGKDGAYPTRTLALLEASPAIDSADGDICAELDFDQRGVARPQQAACDLGAYEFTLAASPTPEATPPAGENPQDEDGSGAPTPPANAAGAMINGGGCSLRSGAAAAPNFWAAAFLVGLGIIPGSIGRRRS